MGFGVDFNVSESWASGFMGSITIRNGNRTPANGWLAEFFAPFEIDSLWGAEIVSEMGGRYVVRNPDWNDQIAAKGSVSFGFRASGAPTPPSDFTVNGRDIPALDLPALSVSSATVSEGDSGTRQAAFTVTLAEASTETVTVAYATANGTAAAGTDYVARAGTITFKPGQTSKTVNVAVRGDTRTEANETFTFALSNADNATIATASGTGRIVNDDTGPSLRVSDVTVEEGTGGTRTAVLTVTLSEAATSAVAVRYETVDGSAVAGSDFTATAGRLTFGPGQTSKTVSIPIRTDSLFEANEAFKVILTSPNGATLSRAQASVRINNDDRAPLPTLSVADVTVTEGDPITTGGVGQGFFRTEGNDIVDAAGNDVKLAGVNWFGLESDRFAPDGLHARGYREMMDQMADLGFNTIRLPFSGQLLDAASRPSGGIDYAKNPDLRGLTGLEIMDRIVDYAGEIGIKIILDHHRPGAGAGATENGLWYDATHSEQDWIANWAMLAARYAGDSTVIGADLHNEPHKGTWGGGGATDWAAAAERAGNAVLEANPDWLIFVEGVESHQGEFYWWGGNLMGVRDRPIQLDIANRVVYSAHDYPNSIFAQPWFSDPNFAQTLPAKFDRMWGYIERENIAPVFLGELGSTLTDPKDLVWLEKITGYLGGDYDGNGVRDMPAGEQGVNWTWWSWNPNSGDTGGILTDDWTTVHANKVAALEPLMFDFGPATTTDGVTTATFRVKLSAASTIPVTVSYATRAGGAEASDFTPVTGSLTFAPGQTSKTVAVRVRGDEAFEPNEAFQFVLSAPRNADLRDGVAVGRIVNDDAAAPARPMAASIAAAGPMIDRRGEDAFTIGAADRNGRLAPGEETTFGFEVEGRVGPDAFDWIL